MRKESSYRVLDRARNRAKALGLRPGDCLIYGRTPFFKSPLAWFFGLIINLKTWDKACHVEVYDCDGYSVAARDGVGVGRYPFRSTELIEIRRPGSRYNHRKAMEYFESVKGQKYDWIGLLSFGLNGLKLSLQRMTGIQPGDMQFCSEYGRRHFRGGCLDPFNPFYDSDKIAPAQFRQTALFHTT